MAVDEKENWSKVPAGIAESCILEEIHRIKSLIQKNMEENEILKQQLKLLIQIDGRQHMIKLEYAKGHMDNDRE